jgi:hypothetical protein
MPWWPIIAGDVEFGCGPVAPEPHNFIAGDTLSWQRFMERFPASAGWILTYVLNSPTQRFIVNQADISTNGDTFVIDIPSAETKTWTPGEYQWLCVAQLPAAGNTPAQRRTAGLGRVVIAIDLLDATAPQDTRSFNEITLCNIELMLARRGGDGVQEYTINGRMLRRYSISDLMQLRGLYKSLVRQERADRGEVQLPTTVAVHFG